MRFRVGAPPAGQGLTEAISGRTFHGFGTTIGTWTTDTALLGQLDSFMRSWVATVEKACSRFLPDSDISRANAAAGTAVQVSPTLLHASEAAIAMADLSDGLCDPTLGAAVINAGYDRTLEALAVEGPGPEGPAQPGGAWSAIGIDHQASTITVPAGFRLDLGGSAKGWAVDAALTELAGTLLTEHPSAGFCISAGGDLAVAGVAPAGGWPVTVRERLDPGSRQPQADVFLARGAVATSGATARRWRHDGHVGHHIIDPRTGRPGTSGWSLVTVFSDSCLVSDVAATTAWLLDDGAEEWLQRFGLGARLVDHAGSAVTVGNLANWLTGAFLA